MNPAPPACGIEFDHIGILVADLDAACRDWGRLLSPLAWTARFDDPLLGVSVRFARDAAGIIYELIAPLNDASPVLSTLKSGKNLLHQLAYRTASLEHSMQRLRAEHAVPVGSPAPALAFRGARVQFLMTPLGFLIELIETDRVLHEFR